MKEGIMEGKYWSRRKNDRPYNEFLTMSGIRMKTWTNIV